MQAAFWWACACAALTAVRGELRCPDDERRCRHNGDSVVFHTDLLDRSVHQQHQYQFLVEGNDITVQYEYGTFLAVHCFGRAVLDSHALPRFRVSLRVPRVILSKCPPPAAGSFERPLFALNATLLRTRSQGNLTLANLPANPPLQAAHFAGLEDLVELKLYSHERPAPEPAQGFLAPLQALNSLLLQGVRLPPGELDRPGAALRSLTLRLPTSESAPRAVLAQLHLPPPELREERLAESGPNSWDTTLRFQSARELENLTLGKWSRPRPAALTHCPNLRTLQLLTPAMEALPEGWVALCGVLETLYITDARRLTSLPQGLLQNATTLRELSLIYGALETLPVGLLDHVPNLRTLDLTSNRLRTLPSAMFAIPVALESLNLSQNQLAADATPQLAELYSLVTLKLASNPRLYDLCDYAGDRPGYSQLFRLKKLTLLSLCKTNVSRICYDWRESMTLLNTLDLRQTNITELRFFDLHYKRENIEGEVLIDGAPVISISYSEEDYQTSQKMAISKATVKLGEDSRVQCDCHMYWTRLALFPAHYQRQASARVSGLQCGDGRGLQAVPLEELVCPAQHVCRNASLPSACRCTARPTEQRRWLISVHCEGVALTGVPQLASSPLVDYDLLLANNHITELHIAHLPQNLKVLDIRNNSVERVDGETARALVASPRRLLVAGNPLVCSCDAAPLLLALHGAEEGAIDLHSAACANGGALHAAPTAPCPRASRSLWLAAALAALLAATAAILGYLKPPKCRFLAADIREWCTMNPPPERNDCFRFDAFLCFTESDREVVQILREQLEGGPSPYRLCLHDRDWIPGRFIEEHIQESIRDSRRTVVVVSRAYLEVHWSAFHKLYALVPRLVLVLLQDPAELPLDTDMRRHVAANSYIRWGDHFFWDKLRRAL